MELYNGKYCISHAELTDGIMSASLIKKWAMEGKMQQARRGCRGSEALYIADSLPTKYRIEVYKRYPDLQAQAESREFIDRIVLDPYAVQFYSEYRIDAVRGLSDDKQLEYVHNASILAAFREVLSRSDSQHLKLSRPKVRRGEFWARAAKALPRIADRFPNSLPENARRLQEKYNEFFKGGKANYEVLVSGKFRNSNAAKVSNEEQEALMVRLMSDYRNLDNEQIASLYNVVAEKMNWHSITSSAVRSWRIKYDLEVSAGRLGERQFYSQRSMQVKRSAPSAPMYLWSLDGWDVELYYQETVTRKGKSVTTYHNRLTVVVVLDAYKKYPIGYAIGKQENAELIKEAMRNAVNHTAELFGQRYRSNQIQSDHYALKTMFPTYAVVGDKITPAKVGNAKAKPIERYFLHLNDTYCHLMPNWSGFGVTSDKNRQPNSDALNRMKRGFPDEAGCREQIRRIIEVERKQKRAEFVAGWSKTAEDRRLPLPQQQYLLTFGAETGYKNALEGSGLNIRLLGSKRTYDCFDINFRRYSHIRWNVKYDPDNLDTVLAVNDDGSLQFLLESKYIQPMALADRQPGDAEQLARIEYFNHQQLEPEVKAIVCGAEQKVIEMFDRHPMLGNTLTKALIADSSGQHKDQRNAKRLAAPDETIDDQGVQETQPAKEQKRKRSTFDLY